MANNTKLTIYVSEGVDVEIQSVPRVNDPPQAGRPEVVPVTPPPAPYAKAYRWNAAGCGLPDGLC
jgi:hypothetical protein